jgi:hypothetical protein
VIPYEDLAASFQARHIAVPMSLAYSVTPEMRVADALAGLDARHFDQAPVEADGRVVGFVLTARLRELPPGRRIRDVSQAIAPGNVVSADAPVASLLEWIEDPGLLFVLDGRTFSGFITVSDFNKQPARAYLYMLLSTLEIVLAELIRERYRLRQLDLLQLLPVDTANEIHAMFEADQDDNVEADVVAYLTLSNLFNIIAKSPPLLASLGAPSRRSFEHDAGRLVELRNGVMHPTRSLVSSKSGLLEMRQIERSLRDLIERTQVRDPSPVEDPG